MYVDNYEESDFKRYPAAKLTVYGMAGMFLITGLMSLFDSCNGDLESKIENGNIESVKSEKSKKYFE